MSQSVNTQENGIGHWQQPDAVQQSSTVEEICHPVVDQMKAWRDIAAAQYGEGEEGDMTGWSSDDNEPESSESRYLKVRHHHHTLHAFKEALGLGPC